MDIKEKINTLAESMGVHPADTRLLLQFTCDAMQQDGAHERFVELYTEGDMEAVRAIIEAYIEAAGAKIKKIIEIYQTRTGAKEALAHQVYHLVNDGV
jgi:DNA-binding GntR family transcriptional regulator